MECHCGTYPPALPYLELVGFTSWNFVEAAVVRIVETSSNQFNDNTVANTREVLSVCRDRCDCPIEVAKGYWTTISFSWAGFELEVFENRIEIYRFDGKRTEIWEEKHVPGETFSPRFMSELPKLP